MGEVKKYVLTGASGCGKSSLVDEFESRGYHILKEVAEPYILEQQSKGIEKPWLESDFQPSLLKKQLDNEANISLKEGLIFLDRGIPDVLGFFKHREQEVPMYLQEKIPKFDYAKIFFLESVGLFDKESFRVETDREQADKIAEIIRKEYEKHGYELISIPPSTVEKRAEMVLKYLK